jgi:hypothetical protein
MPEWIETDLKIIPNSIKIYNNTEPNTYSYATIDIEVSEHKKENNITKHRTKIIPSKPFYIDDHGTKEILLAFQVAVPALKILESAIIEWLNKDK